MSLRSWFIFLAAFVVPPAIFWVLVALIGLISLPLTYTTILTILGGYAGWAACLHYLKLREFLQDIDKPKTDTDRNRRFSGRSYCQHLIHRHRFFDVNGLITQGIYTLELERVFGADCRTPPIS